MTSNVVVNASSPLSPHVGLGLGISNETMGLSPTAPPLGVWVWALTEEYQYSIIAKRKGKRMKGGEGGAVIPRPPLWVWVWVLPPRKPFKIIAKQREKLMYADGVIPRPLPPCGGWAASYAQLWGRV